MNPGEIAFPNLGIHFNNIPTYFTVFGFKIAFYGLIVGIGFLAGISMAAWLGKKTGQNPDDYWDFAIYIIIFALIGARIYYVVFAWDEYKNNLSDIFKVRNGGLAIYGGVIAGFITLFVWSKLKKKKALLVGDTAMAGLILGQAIGRWGNFVNREVFGEYYNGLFSMQICIDDIRDFSDVSAKMIENMPDGANYVNVHPTFLYESVWNLFILALILFFTRRKHFDGEMCLLYLGGYGIGRFVIEGIRTDTLFIPGTATPVSQFLAAIMVLFAVITEVTVRCIQTKRAKKQPVES